MPIYYTIVLIAAIFTLSVVHLKWRITQVENADSVLDDTDPHLSTVLATLTPLVLLFYTEAFWENLLYLLPCYLYMAVVLRLIIGKKGTIYAIQYLLALLPGGVFTVILLYFLFFHDGVLTESPAVVSQEQDETSGLTWGMSLWPYGVYILFIIFFLSALRAEAAGRTGGDRSKHLLLTSIIIFPILALFTDFYWWTLLASLLLIYFALNITTAREKVSVRGGMGFVYMYVLMMTFGFSVLLYALLY